MDEVSSTVQSRRMAQPRPTFRVFISSTFSDFKVERDALQEQVFPRLRELCHRHACVFQAIDLRWGVSHDAYLGQQAMRICIEEIRRCQHMTPRPNFLVLLGDRYGARPLPFEIPQAEFAVIVDCAQSDRLRELLKTWYREDLNGIPPVRVLQPRSGRYLDESRWQEEIVLPLQETMAKAAEHFLPSARWKYECSATEQEVQHGALAAIAGGVHGHACAFFRSVRGIPENETGRHFRDSEPDAAQRLLALKGRMRAAFPTSLREYTTGWTSGTPDYSFVGSLPASLDACLSLPTPPTGSSTLCADVWHLLSNVILDEVARIEAAPAGQRDAEVHIQYGAAKSEHFVGRNDPLKAIQDYIHGTSERPFVALGQPGSGKSALIAAAAREATVLGTHQVVVRFVGATPASSNTVGLLRDLSSEILRSLHAEDVIHNTQVPSDDIVLIEVLRDLLSGRSPDSPLLVFVDGIDRLAGPTETFPFLWVPQRLPPHVRLILSANPRSSTAPAQPPSGLEHAERIVLGPLHTDEMRDILAHRLRSRERTLTGDQRTAILGSASHETSPLWVAIAAEHVARLRSWEPPPKLDTTTRGLVHQTIDRLCREDEHGRDIVCSTLKYVACSRRGLAEEELLDLLSEDREVMSALRRRAVSSSNVNRLPAAVWARLFADLGWMFSARDDYGGVLLTFDNRAAGEAATSRILDPQSRWRVHRTLSTYFQRRADARGSQQWGNAPVRALSELPFQRLGDVRERRAEHLFADPNFVAASTSQGLLDQLLGDLAMAAERFPESAGPLYAAILESADASRERPSASTVLLVNRLMARSLSPIARARLARSMRQLDASGPWLAALTPLPKGRSIRRVVTVSSRRRLLHTLSEASELCDYSLDSSKIIRIRRPPSKVPPADIAVHPDSGDVAWLDRTGALFLTSALLPTRLRTRCTCLAFFGSGLLGADSDNRLVFVRGDRSSIPLLSHVDSMSAEVCVSGDRRTALLVSGDRQGAQQLFKLIAGPTEPSVERWMSPDAPVTAVTINESGTFAVLAMLSRTLLLVDVLTAKIVTQCDARVADGSAIRGPVQWCALSEGDGTTNVLGLTMDGEVLFWNTASKTIHRAGSWRAPLQATDLRAVAALSASKGFLVATDQQYQVVHPGAVSAEPFASPITRCSLSEDGWCTTICREGKRVTWLKHPNPPFDLVHANRFRIALGGLSIAGRGDRPLHAGLRLDRLQRTSKSPPGREPRPHFFHARSTRTGKHSNLVSRCGHERRCRRCGAMLLP